MPHPALLWDHIKQAGLPGPHPEIDQWCSGSGQGSGWCRCSWMEGHSGRHRRWLGRDEYWGIRPLAGTAAGPRCPFRDNPWTPGRRRCSKGASWTGPLRCSWGHRFITRNSSDGKQKCFFLLKCFVSLFLVLVLLLHKSGSVCTEQYCSALACLATLLVNSRREKEVRDMHSHAQKEKTENPFLAASQTRGRGGKEKEEAQPGKAAAAAALGRPVRLARIFVRPEPFGGSRLPETATGRPDANNRLSLKKKSNLIGCCSTVAFWRRHKKNQKHPDLFIMTKHCVSIFQLNG